MLAKHARSSLPESHYQESVRKYLARKYRCIPVREPKLDIVGFSLNTGIYHCRVQANLSGGK